MLTMYIEIHFTLYLEIISVDKDVLIKHDKYPERIWKYYYNSSFAICGLHYQRNLLLMKVYIMPHGWCMGSITPELELETHRFNKGQLADLAAGTHRAAETPRD